jgi:hypothetical protein
MTPYQKYYSSNQILIICNDSFGKKVVYDKIIFIETSTKIKEVRTVEDWIRDADDSRILYEEDKRIMLHDRKTWRNDIIYSGFEKFGGAYLAPNGVIFTVKTNSGDRKYHWLSKKLITLCTNNTLDLRVSGNYALFSCNTGIIFRDLTIGINTILKNSGGYWNLASNGDVCYSKVDPTKKFWMLYRYRNGKETRIANGVMCIIDRQNVMYQKSISTQTTLALYTSTGEYIVDKDQGSKIYDRDSHYFVNSGWSAYMVDKGTGTYQIYVRSPGGITTKVTKSSTSVSSIAALGRNGEVWFYRNGLYYVEVGKSPVQISDAGYPIYIGSQWHVAIGRSLFMVKPYSRWPDSGTVPPDMGPPDYGPRDQVAESRFDLEENDTVVDTLASDENPQDNGKVGCTGCSYRGENIQLVMEGSFYMLILIICSILLRKTNS